MRIEDLTTGHVGATVVVDTGNAVIEGKLDWVRHDQAWVEERRICDPENVERLPGRRTSTLTIGPWEATIDPRIECTVRESRA